MNKEERADLIDKFLTNQLEDLELARFQAMLDSDPELKKSLRLELELRQALNEKSDFNLFKKLLGDTHHEYFEESKSMRFIVWKMTAAVLIIAAFSFLLWRNSVTGSPSYIYDKYFEPYEAPVNLRGADIAGMDDNFMLGLIKYDKQEYTGAITLFQKAYEKDYLNYTARFLTAMAYMIQKDFTKAEPILKELSEDDSHLFQDQARWYLGLLYLTDEDETNNEKAQKVWDDIENKDILNKTEELI
ncbi:MAG: tetratricopeptide repeat protein [Cytophagia bacterium]|nr:tetratricopeptide repeat protein [Cytophagia bacterium]